MPSNPKPLLNSAVAFMTTTNALTIAALSPIIGFTKNYIIEWVQKPSIIWSAPDNTVHSPEPNGVLPPHAVVMFVWVILLIVQIACHPSNASQAALSSSERRAWLSVTVSDAAAEPMLSGEDKESDKSVVQKSENRVSIATDYAVHGQLPLRMHEWLPTWALPGRGALTLSGVRRLHKLNGYFAVAMAVSGTGLAAWFDGENDHAGKIQTKLRNGDADVRWSDPGHADKKMCLYKAFRNHLDPLLGLQPFNGFAIYTISGGA
jgi:hypothetical protein